MTFKSCSKRTKQKLRLMSKDRTTPVSIYLLSFSTLGPPRLHQGHTETPSDEGNGLTFVALCFTEGPGTLLFHLTAVEDRQGNMHRAITGWMLKENRQIDCCCHLFFIYLPLALIVLNTLTRAGEYDGATIRKGLCNEKRGNGEPRRSDVKSHVQRQAVLF